MTSKVITALKLFVLVLMFQLIMMVFNLLLWLIFSAFGKTMDITEIFSIIPKTVMTLPTIAVALIISVIVVYVLLALWLLGLLAQKMWGWR